MSDAAWRPLALITAMVLSGVTMDLLAGRKFNELFRETSGDESEYEDRWCLCFLFCSDVAVGETRMLSPAKDGISVAVISAEDCCCFVQPGARLSQAGELIEAADGSGGLGNTDAGRFVHVA